MPLDPSPNVRDSEAHGPASVLRGWPKPLRILIGLFVSALGGAYFSKIVYTLSGAGPNSMAMWKDLGYSIALLMFVNLLALPRRKFWLANGICIALGMALVTAELIVYASPGQYASYWKGYFFIITGPLINAWLFVRYRAAVID